MNVRELKRRLAPYQGYHRPADDGGDLGGDRGDSWTPTEEDPLQLAKELEKKEGGATPPADKPADKPAGEGSALRDSGIAPEGAGETPAEGTGEGAGEDDKDDKAKGKIIPLDRHEKILAKERERREALERQLASFQGVKQVETLNNEITKLEDKLQSLDAEYATALADGDTKKAAALMRDIRATDRQIADARTEHRVSVATAQATEQARYDIALERVEGSFPQLNPDNDAFDEDLLNDVADLKAVYQQRGDTPTKALQKAVKKLLGEPKTSAQEEAITVTPRVNAADVAGKRKTDAVAKTADAVSRTPPSTSKVGQDSDKLGGGLNAKDVIKLSQDEFAKLSEKDLAKMRGDEL